MNENTTNQWNEVGSLLNGLALKLKLHTEEAVGAEKETVSNAARSLGDSLEKAFETLRDAAMDPAMKDDVLKVAKTLSSAVSQTLSGLGDNIRKSVKPSEESPE